MSDVFMVLFWLSASFVAVIVCLMYFDCAILWLTRLVGEKNTEKKETTYALLGRIQIVVAILALLMAFLSAVTE